MYLRCSLTETFLAPTTLPPSTTETTPQTNEASTGNNNTEPAANGTITWNDKVFDILGVEGIHMKYKISLYVVDTL